MCPVRVHRPFRRGGVPDYAVTVGGAGQGRSSCVPSLRRGRSGGSARVGPARVGSARSCPARFSSARVGESWWSSKVCSESLSASDHSVLEVGSVEFAEGPSRAPTERQKPGCGQLYARAFLAGTVGSVADDLNLSDIRSLTEALARIPNGVDAARLAAALSVWSVESHRAPAPRKPFPDRFSDLVPTQLSDLSARTVSEADRICELVGLLSGLETHLKLKAKQARAQARAGARRQAAREAAEASTEGDVETVRKASRAKVPTVSELNDLAEEDPRVREVDDQLSLVELLLASVSAAKEATYLRRDAISREITFRCAQMDARI